MNSFDFLESLQQLDACAPMTGVTRSLASSVDDFSNTVSDTLWDDDDDEDYPLGELSHGDHYEPDTVDEVFENERVEGIESDDALSEFSLERYVHQQLQHTTVSDKSNSVDTISRLENIALSVTSQLTQAMNHIAQTKEKNEDDERVSSAYSEEPPRIILELANRRRTPARREENT